MTISEADRSSGGTASTPDGSAAVDVPESPTDDHQGSRSLLRNLRMWRYLALTVWLAVLVWQFIEVGLAFDRTRLILWMCLGLAAASIGRRRVITVLVDWLPFVGILMLYDLTRNVAQWMGMPTHWHLAVDADQIGRAHV